MRWILAVMLLGLITIPSEADDAILAFWDFEQVEGRSVPDKAYQFNGVLFNGTDPYVLSDDQLGPFVTAGYKSPSSALAFNTPDRKDRKMDSMFIGNGYKLKLGQSDWTMTGWIKCTGFEPKETNHMVVMTNTRPNQHGLNLLVLRPGHSARGCLNVSLRPQGDEKPIYVNSRKPIDDGKWYWFAVRVQDKKLSLWLDGQKQGEQKFRQTTTADPSGMLFFATRDGYHCAFRGALDDLLIYNKAMDVKTDDKGNLVSGQLFDYWKNGIQSLEK
ncbi:MAG: LamG-like jellyroll fold domain-containing protein [Phycisphaeraceae bacterium JB051]